MSFSLLWNDSSFRPQIEKATAEGQTFLSYKMPYYEGGLPCGLFVDEANCELHRLITRAINEQMPCLIQTTGFPQSILNTDHCWVNVQNSLEANYFVLTPAAIDKTIMEFYIEFDKKFIQHLDTETGHKLFKDRIPSFNEVRTPFLMASFSIYLANSVFRRDSQLISLAVTYEPRKTPFGDRITLIANGPEYKFHIGYIDYRINRAETSVLVNQVDKNFFSQKSNPMTVHPNYYKATKALFRILLNEVNFKYICDLIQKP